MIRTPPPLARPSAPAHGYASVVARFGRSGIIRPRPNGAKFTSPGQRPGISIPRQTPALKGRNSASASVVARFGRSGTALVFLATLVLSLALSATHARAEVQIERIFLPHGASPSSFAIGLPGGINFCFDPVRGSVNYVWTGGWVDLTPARPGAGKFIAAAKLLGPLAYQETGFAPLRRGDPARPPTIELTGYTLRDDAVEFRYTVDGTPVREEISARPDGTALVRRFHIEAGTDATWWHIVNGKPATELRREAAGTFVLELPLAKSTP